MLPNREVKIMTQNHSVGQDTPHGKVNPNKYIGTIFQIRIESITLKINSKLTLMLTAK